MSRRVVVLLLLVCVVSAPARAEPGPDGAFEVFLPPAPDGARPTVHVDLLWGRLDVRTHRLATVRYRARASRNVAGASSEIAPRLAIDRPDGGLRLGQQPPEEGVFEDLRLELWLPPEVDLAVEITRGGDVSVRGVGGDVTITNHNGSVVADQLSGAVAVNAANGSIEVGFARVPGDSVSILSTLNGSVRVCLPAGYDGWLDLSTRGDPIDSRFAILPGEPAPSIERSGRRLRGRVGGGSASVRAATVNGEVRIEVCPDGG